MAAETPAAVRPVRRPWWRLVTQFSLRTLLLLVTAASVGCWWFLQPKTREEQYEQTPLRLHRQVRLEKYEPETPIPFPGTQIETISGQQFKVVNAGHWRLLDHRGYLLVDGRYENGQQHGRWITYHTNGRKAADGRMERGTKVGRWRTWDEERALVSEVMYSEGMK
jgi:hypothetical protein